MNQEGMTQVHPTAIVHPSAVIGAGTTVGPFSVIGEHVVLGADNRVGSHVVIEGRTTIGDGNAIFQFASVGAQPQDLKFRGEPSELRIGSQNIIREFTTLQPGTDGGGMLTAVGDKNLFMANSHVGHDTHIGDGCVFANSAALAGHVTIGSRVTVGGLAGIHQFVRLGDYSMIAAGAMVAKDIPPFCMAQGDRAGLVGLNTIGLKRAGFSAEEISQISKLYKALFLGHGAFSERLATCVEEWGTQARPAEFLNFVRESKRGVTFPRAAGVDSATAGTGA